jgi:hypothetical protein
MKTKSTQSSLLEVWVYKTPLLPPRSDPLPITFDMLPPLDATKLPDMETDELLWTDAVEDLLLATSELL